MNSRTMLLLVLFAVLSLKTAHGSTAVAATIYYVETCGKCFQYVASLENSLREMDVTVEKKNLIDSAENREELAHFVDGFSLPLELRSNVIVVLNRSVVLIGPVPVSVIRQLLEMYSDHDFPKLVIYYDPYGDPEHYRVVDYHGETHTYPASTSPRDWNIVKHSELGNELESYYPITTVVIVSLVGAALAVIVRQLRQT